MAPAAPIRFSSSIESISPDEQATSEKINQVFDTILETTSRDHGQAVRAVHAKGHGILEGTLTIQDGLPPELAQGLFAQAGAHKIYMRISTTSGDILDDSVSLPRGLAIKVLDVDGERLPNAAGNTQDFVMINGPVFQSKTTNEFLANLKLLAKTTDRLETTKKVLSSVLQGANTALEAVGVESSKVQSLGGAPNVEPLGETYYSVTPFRFGDYVAKFSVAPVSLDLQALTGKEIDASGRPNVIRETVRSEMQTAHAIWEMRVQLYRDLQKQPIEDSTIEWKEEDSPWQTVGTITAQPQDSWDTEQVRKVEEEMRFSIWTGLAAHQPLGNINRARKATYEHSAAFRATFNRCPIHEPSNS